MADRNGFFPAINSKPWGHELIKSPAYVVKCDIILPSAYSKSKISRINVSIVWWGNMLFITSVGSSRFAYVTGTESFGSD